jgi:LuxR family maltose regulon positive regulatory protein
MGINIVLGSSSIVLFTKITPPPRSTRTLPRPRVSRILLQTLDYRLAILQAGAGYGKTTALAELSQDMQPLVWYQVNQEDNDPLVFLSHLCHAFLQAYPYLHELPIQFLEAWSGTQGPLPWRWVTDQLINTLSLGISQPILFILDDAHLIIETSEVAQILDRLIGLAPSNLHVLLSGRPTITLPTLARWRAQGEVLSLDQMVLAFDYDEIAALYAKQYKLALNSEEVESLLGYTEGWAIALQLIWQSTRRQITPTLDIPPHGKIDSLEALCDLLTHEIFECQPNDIREFLLVTAVLRELTEEACDALLIGAKYQIGSAKSLLAYLQRQELFVVETAAGNLRYHHVFHNFLHQLASAEQRDLWNRLAAAYFQTKDRPEEAIYHLQAAQAWEELACLLDARAGALLTAGRLDTLAAYLDNLPPETLHKHPMLVFMLGELARLHSRFEEAQGWYEQAKTSWRAHGQPEGVARALRGQARVFLDTVNPSQAEQLLEQAIRLSDGFEDREAQVRLFELLAENKLNSGKLAEAERLRQRAETLRVEGPSNEQLWFRVLLRTGRLEEARNALEARAQAERLEPVQTPRAHRETLLILSLIYAFMGQGEKAYAAAIEGTQRGEQLHSPFVTAVGHMRQGHALMLANYISNPVYDYAQSREEFEISIAISHLLEVPRLRVEAHWGLCRIYGYQGDLQTAQAYAQEGIEIATSAGDEWIASLTRLTMGASLVLSARYEAAEQWLNKSALGFQECSDAFGCTAARLWLCLAWFKQKQYTQVEMLFPSILADSREKGYDFLFTRPTLVGPPDERALVPLLILARQRDWEASFSNKLLESMGLAGIDLHPGYCLRIKTLGSFQAWRGTELITASSWRREKSRQLFQLLLTHRHAPLDREQICEYLWPEADPATARRNYKSTLNTLYQVLEPDREPGSDSAFIVREGSTYALRPNADICLDADQFINLVKQADKTGGENIERLQQAIDLYRGEYLPDMLYEAWTAEERERLAAMYLEAVDRLSELLINSQQYNRAIDLCQKILAQDNCWERAYRHLMIAYHQLGDHGQIGRTYQRCVQTLKDELDVTPSLETTHLYKRLIQ